MSHDFAMHGAKPVGVFTMTAEEDDGKVAEHTIYKWIVPWEKEPSTP